MLPREDQMARGHAVAQSHNAGGNIMGRAHAIPIMDTILYQVEFAGGKIIELTANVIAEPMYIQCNADVNYNLILDVLGHYYKDNKTISFKAQQSRVRGRPVYEADQ